MNSPPKCSRGNWTFSAVPVNLGSVLYNNSDGAVQLLAVNTLGVIYLVEKGGQTVTDWNSLKGQTIYATGKGSTPEYALNYLLEENGLDPAADVTIEWKSEPLKSWRRWLRKTTSSPCCHSPLSLSHSLNLTILQSAWI